MIFSKHYGDTDFITGLRAVAATMVVICHTSALADLGWVGSRISGAGAAGVQAFFVISGFSIAAALASTPTFKDFFARRLVRIIPLYYFTLLIAFILTVTGFTLSGWRDSLGTVDPATALILDLVFLSWIITQTANDLIGVEWSIPVEVFWYIVLAGLLPRLIKINHWLICFSSLLIISALSRVFSEVVFDRSLWASWAPTTYGAWFILGAFTYKMRSQVLQAKPAVRRATLVVALLIFILGLITDVGLTSLLIGLSASLVIVAHPGSAQRLDPLSTQPMLFLGTISYGIYLWHMFVILLVSKMALPSPFAHFAMTYTLTIGAAILSYLILERPAVRAYARYAHHQLQKSPTYKTARDPHTGVPK